MRAKALFEDVSGYLFTNRFHIFVMPIVLTLFWNTILRLPLDLTYYVMVMFTTAGGYIFNIYTDAAEDAINYPSQYRIFKRESRMIKPTIAGCYLAGLLLSLHAGLAFVLYGGFVHLLASLYSTPIRVRGKTIRIKELPVLKNVYAGLHWSIALILTMYLYTHTPLRPIAYFAMVLSFLMNYFVELMFDMRDVRGDTLSGVRTLPVLLGESTAVRLLTFVHVFACLLVFYGVWVHMLTSGFLILAAVHLPAGLLFIRAYRRLGDKELASHMYLVYAAAVLTLGILWTPSLWKLTT